MSNPWNAVPAVALQVERAAEAVQEPGIPVEELAGRDDPDVGIVEGADDVLQPVGCGEGVGIDERDDVARRPGDAEVPSAGAAEVPVRLHEPESRVASDPLPQEFAASVGRGVVDHDHLEIVEALRGEARQAALDVLAVVVAQDDDAGPHPVPLRVIRRGDGSPRGPGSPRPRRSPCRQAGAPAPASP